jgi:hypothetical protein
MRCRSRLNSDEAGNRRPPLRGSSGDAADGGFAGGIAAAAAADGDGSEQPFRTSLRTAKDLVGHSWRKTVRRSHWLLVVVLAALLAGVGWYFVSVWRATPAMPLYGCIIGAVAATLAVVVGCGSIALMYHSRRKGYDVPARASRRLREQSKPA